MRRYAVLALAILSLAASGASAQSNAAYEGVRRAVLDYVEGFYEGDTLKLQLSIRPNRVRQNNRQAPATAPKDIVVYEAQDQTASAKLTATWGTDYLLLGKFDGKWMITHVLWQTTME